MVVSGGNRMIQEQLYKNEEEKMYVEALQFLSKTDYIANKIIEYQFLKKELGQDYTDVLNKREKAREVIRQYTEGE